MKKIIPFIPILGLLFTKSEMLQDNRIFYVSAIIQACSIFTLCKLLINNY